MLIVWTATRTTTLFYPGVLHAR